MLKELHWFPVHLRVEFKILLITFKALHDCATVYIKDLIKQYQPVHELRSSQKKLGNNNLPNLGSLESTQELALVLAALRATLTPLWCSSLVISKLPAC